MNFLYRFSHMTESRTPEIYEFTSDCISLSNSEWKTLCVNVLKKYYKCRLDNSSETVKNENELLTHLFCRAGLKPYAPVRIAWHFHHYDPEDEELRQLMYRAENKETEGAING